MGVEKEVARLAAPGSSASMYATNLYLKKRKRKKDENVFRAAGATAAVACMLRSCSMCASVYAELCIQAVAYSRSMCASVCASVYATCEAVCMR